jgi:predicted DNA-binding transcriptional regulator AlpA
MQKLNLSHLADKWPSSVVARRKVSEFSGGILSEKYCANLDSQGLGPPRVRIGRQVAYPVTELIAWLESRASLVVSGGE